MVGLRDAAPFDGETVASSGKKVMLDKKIIELYVHIIPSFMFLGLSGYESEVLPKIIATN